MIKVAVIGVGYWGPNLVRNLSCIEDVEITVLCDFDRVQSEKMASRYCRNTQIITDYQEILKKADVDAVVISTPIKNHFEIGYYFLSKGKHVFIEKPLSENVDQCSKMIELAINNKCILMVGHVFEYNSIVQWIRKYLESGKIGKLLYIHSQRLNLGRIQKDVNALASFAPHDISIINYWLQEEPIQVSARGFSYISKNVEDVVFLVLDYPHGVGVHVHLSWLDPRKIRLMTLVGSDKMIVYDDTSQDAKIKIFDKGVENLNEFMKTPNSFAEFNLRVRSGDLTIPSLSFHEPLLEECKHFIDCIEKGKEPLTNGESGLRVVKVLEAAQKSLRSNGKPIKIN